MIYLIVEDNPVTGASLAGMLRRRGHVAEWSSSWQDACVKFPVVVPDVVVLDLFLPDADITTILDGVESWEPRPRIVSLTAADSDVLLNLNAVRPWLEIVRKPADPDSLVALLEESTVCEDR